MMNRLLVAALASLVVLTGSAQGQDLTGYTGPFPFEGFYAGAQGGGYVGEDMAPQGGVVAGANFGITDGVVAGLEFQGSYVAKEQPSFDALALGRVGVKVSDQMLAYGAVGGGRAGEDGVYALGGGVEYGVVSNLSVRGEGLAVGEWGSGVDRGKLSGGLLWHLD